MSIITQKAPSTTEKTLIQLGSNEIRLDVDTEYQPVTDKPTNPISIQIKGFGLGEKLFIHPKTTISAPYLNHPTFKSPFAPIDYLNLEYREVDPSKRSKNYLNINLGIFFSFKDIEFAFEMKEDFMRVLSVLERTRRIRINNGRKSSVALPWEVRVRNKQGKSGWVRLSLKVTDICAMQGAAGLSTYAKNVGIAMNAKDTYTSDEKGRMVEMYMRDAKEFESYALGDAVIWDIRSKTTEYYNSIAALIGVKPRECWGMSTGKIVASMVSEWVSNQIGIDSKKLYEYTGLAGQAGITKLSKIIGKQGRPLIYAAMTDGGRAVKERVEVKAKGILDDIDIAGCYGNGLKNQPFAVGNPTIHLTKGNGKKSTLREWLSENQKELIPGLWYARISWKNAPFKQDLLISKVNGAFTNWENGITKLDSDLCTAAESLKIMEDDKLYDASMVLTTREGHQCAINHDLLQIFQKLSSNKNEWSWFLDNAYIDSSAIYRKSDEVKSISLEMKSGIILKRGDIKIPKGWVRVDMNNLMDTLLTERGKAKLVDGKGSPKDVFLKLIINTIYGCIASGYFSTEGTGISNAVVGNNITARARALAWMMAKGFHSYCTVTDGGVLDVNKVLSYRKMSMDILEGVSRSEFTDGHRHVCVDQVPLFGEPVNKESMKDRFSDIDGSAWNHLKKQFKGIDIVDKDQFSFESKSWYVGLTLHSKVDYRLEKSEGGYKIALRGMPRIWSEALQEKITDIRANKIFDAIENGIPYRLTLTDTRLLGLAEYHQRLKKGTDLLPHDEVSVEKRYYSHTPLGKRFETMSEYKATMREYENAKEEAKQTPDDTQAAQIVASVE